MKISHYVLISFDLITLTLLPRHNINAALVGRFGIQGSKSSRARRLLLDHKPSWIKNKTRNIISDSGSQLSRHLTCSNRLRAMRDQPPSHASEILTVLEGTLEVGFVTANPENRQITKILQKGDAFVFTAGLIHYQRNVGSPNAAAIAAFSSRNPGVISIAKAVFGSAPDISSDILVKSFQVDNGVINFLRSKF
ncbi:Putative germin-like protein 2-3 [Morus notabilis]|uniref:Germin-like protein n=1 Tax=Morus notabilis TaxID=981085 RepID=W9RWA4_9ROSA|nr:Putative germin-like protein 2-3 [Morus notabilis]